jgi:ATP-dependent helicase YprA (DUF1998 family)
MTTTLERALQLRALFLRQQRAELALRDSQIDAALAEQIDAETLCRGPFLEASPPHAMHETLRSAVARHGLTNDEFFVSALDGDRPLYAHQWKALEALRAGRHVVVAAGTASGKSECYLYPILLHLQREQQAAALGAGVRALMLYPMNALAYDQAQRLGGMLTRLRDRSAPLQATFGRYDRETKESAAQSDAEFVGEIVGREALRRRPPHLLITNSVMLEHMLLRASDQPLFDGPNARSWRFVVLDEVHLHRGTRAVELALLLRRLRRRLMESGHDGRLQFIATSATLAHAASSHDTARTFAAELFGADDEGRRTGDGGSRGATAWIVGAHPGARHRAAAPRPATRGRRRGPGRSQRE